MTRVDVKFKGDPVSVPIDRLTTVELPARVFRGRLTGMLFETDKAFLLPSAMAGIRGLKRYYDQHPGLSVLVTGHTDTVGDSGYNERLSQERAEAVAAYLVEDVETWFAHYAGTPNSRRWGTAEDQHMLSALPPDGPPHYAGPVHGVPDPPTRQAIRDFQANAGLEDDGFAGPDTRRALIAQYMAVDETSLPVGATLETHGCGEHHPAVPTPDHTDEPENRRVEIFLFEGLVDPPPRPACGNCPEYPQWLLRLVETVDFTDEPGWLDVGVSDDEGNAVAGAAVRLEGTANDQEHTAPNGLVRFLNLPVGAYQVVVVADGFEDVVFPVGVIPGEPPPPPTSLPPPPPTASPDTQLGFAADGSPSPGGGGSAGGQVGPNAASAALASTDTIIHIVGEIPEGGPPTGLLNRVKEGEKTANHDKFERLSAFCTWDLGPNDARNLIKEFDKNGKAIIKLDKSQTTGGTAPVEKGTLTIVLQDPPPAGTNAHIYTLRDPDDPSQTLTDPPIEAGQTTRVKISTRLRSSLWASTNVTSAANLAGMSDQIDDLSILTTVTNKLFNTSDDPAQLGVEWDDFFRTAPNQNPAEADFYNQIIQTCHSKGVQALVGFAHAPNLGGVSDQNLGFNRWMVALNGLSASAQQAAIDNFAQRLVKFVEDNLPAFDGISFDIEHIAAVAQMSIPDQAKFFTLFYQAVAKLLMPRNKVVAIAVGAFDNQAASLAVGDLQARFDHPTTQAFARAHPYQLALGFPNIILRPMAFGHLSAQSGVAASQKWHEDIIEYAIGTVKLPAEQFQLGVFLGNGAGQVSLQFGSTLEKRCTELLRPNRVGLIGFAVGPNHNWNATGNINKHLNDGEKPPNTPGQPFQAPIQFNPQTL